MDAKNETFNYTYSAAQQEEIRNILEKYVSSVKEEDKMEKLRRLDAGVTRPSTIVSLIVGIISALVLGIGMCCTMIWADTLFIPGIIIGVIGIIGGVAAYPIYTRITKKQREKLSPEIMRLSDELLR